MRDMASWPTLLPTYLTHPPWGARLYLFLLGARPDCSGPQAHCYKLASFMQAHVSTLSSREDVSQQKPHLPRHGKEHQARRQEA